MSSRMPWGPLQDIERALSRARLPRRRRLLGPWAPTSDVVETDNAYVITAELPGVSDSDVEISVDDGVLTLEGSRRQEATHEDERHHQRERSFGNFRRRFPLPADVAADRITAGVAYGVLKVTLPKAVGAAPEPRKIPIASADDTNVDGA